MKKEKYVMQFIICLSNYEKCINELTSKKDFHQNIKIHNQGRNLITKWHPKK